MIDLLKEQNKKENAVLVALSGPWQSSEQTEEYLNELEFLASTIGITTLGKFRQRMDLPDKRTFIGKGKLEEVKLFMEHEKADVVIFDDDLSPSQLRNLENELNVKVYDRSLLILDIFLYRAQTAQAKTQVELARAQYLLPRLTRMWTHLERQRGGTGTRGGAGEKEIETDKRMVRDKITRLKQKLDKIDKQKQTQRKGRDQLVRVALVGYTNVGKSTIMQLLSKSNIFAENKLFATVDSTVRKIVIGNIPMLLTDTVGFIRKLPTTLIECFKSTLDEVRQADILLHVIDVSHPNFQDQMRIVNKTLAEIGASDKPVITVFNKIDQYENVEFEGDEEETTLDQLKATYLNKDHNSVFISALHRDNVQELRKAVFDEALKVHYRIYPNYVKPDYVEWGL